MKFSKSSDLALHGLWQLAVKKKKMLLVAEMARAQKVSETYLAKVFQKLARRGLVKSTRGKKGGFTLAKSPAEIAITDVVRAIETDEPLFTCLGPERGCRGGDQCELKKVFAEAEQRLYDTLSKYTFKDLIERSRADCRKAWLG